MRNLPMKVGAIFPGLLEHNAWFMLGEASGQGLGNSRLPRQLVVSPRLRPVANDWTDE